jgi:hypothetical protein
MSTLVFSHSSNDRLDAASSEDVRAVHFVGSLPAVMTGDHRQMMQWFLDHSADTTLTGLPCDPAPRWIIDWLDGLATIDALEPVRTGHSADYDDMPTYRLKHGHWLESEDLSLGRATHTDAVMAAREQLHDDRDLPPHQVSIPNPYDLSLFTFGSPAAAVTHLPVFRQAVLDDVHTIHRQHDNQVVFQLETPAVLATLDRTPRPLWLAAVRALAKQVARVFADGPREATWRIHLCHGDLGHQPLFPLTDLVPAVQFLNALHKQLHRLRIPMPAAHIPMCTGTDAPPTDPRFYRALRHLRRDIDVIAGLVDETHPTKSRAALGLVETELDRPVLAVAAACGHGRRTVPDAVANAALSCELAHHTTDIPAR